MTRSDDSYISLVDRSLLANQLKADLFVSIHVNSAIANQNNAWGIETFYLDAQGMVPRRGKAGFLFVNFEKDGGIVNLLNEQLRQTLTQSKALAAHIQNSLIQFLGHHNIDINDRGIKPEKFRTFLQSGIPAALVEVGFITNPKEAGRLAKKSIAV